MAGGLLSSPPVRVLTLVFITAGCGYRAGSFQGPHGPFAGTPSTVDCLDIAISREADSHVGPVLAFDFGNRCSRPIVVDFQHARVEAVTADGRRIPLDAYDPDGAIVPLTLDAQLPGHEAIAYASIEMATEVCIDVATLVHAAGTQSRCFTRPAVAR